MNPVDILAEAARIYPAWWQAHESRPVTVMELAEPVRAAADPDSRGRQFIAVKLCMLDGVRSAGLVLARRKSVGKWSPARYLLNRVDVSGEADQCAASPKVSVRSVCILSCGFHGMRMIAVRSSKPARVFGRYSRYSAKLGKPTMGCWYS